jgi:hypothetical protein
VLTPTIASKGTTAWLSDGAAFVKGMFQNEEDIEAYATVTAEVTAQTKTYTNASTTKYHFPPHETVDVIISIELEDSDYRYLSSQRYLRTLRIYLSEVDEITCPDCGGTGVGSELVVCPECAGTGFVTCPTCGGSLIDGGGQNEAATDFPLEGVTVGVGVAAAVAIAAVLVVKRKRVSEQDLRRLPFSEFQNWVVQRLSGKVSSVEDSRMGIDGYTAEGDPIQIKQSDDVDRSVIDSFASAMGRRKARNGIIVAFSFGRGVYEGIARAKIHYRLEIKMVTVKELIEKREIALL